MVEEDVETLRNLVTNYNLAIENNYQYWLVEEFRRRVLTCLDNVLTDVDYAYSMYPTTVYEYNIRRSRQNDAIGGMYHLKNIFQQICRIFPVNFKTYIPFINNIDNEIGLLKTWRRDGNKLYSWCIENVVSKTLKPTTKTVANIVFLYNKYGNATLVSEALCNVQDQPWSLTYRIDQIKSGNLLYDAYPISNQSANCRYEAKSLGTWTSLSQVNNFLAEYTHANDYRGTSHSPLSLGNYVTIQDGTYNSAWVIVGFDTEIDRGEIEAGYGISLIPYQYKDTMKSCMNSTNVTTGGYQGSYMHNTTLPAIASKLNNVLSTHMIERSILTSNAVTNGASSGWSWEGQKLSLLSEVQVYGTVLWGAGEYNIGEACNKLPIFNYVNHVAFGRRAFWLREVTSASDFALASGNGNTGIGSASNVIWVRPLLYIR